MLDSRSNTELVNENNPLANLEPLFLLTISLVILQQLASHANSNNHLIYKNRTARLMGSLIIVLMNLFHTKPGKLVIEDTKGKLIAAVGHGSSLDAFVLASKSKGPLSSYLSTDLFNAIPFVKFILDLFNVILVKSNGTNDEALKAAEEVLRAEGSVAVFPTGGFPNDIYAPNIYIFAGAARMAVKLNIPLTVVKIGEEGYWFLKNPFIPFAFRNNSIFRAFFAWFHPNNIEIVRCKDIVCHLDEQNKALSDEEKIELIRAELYVLCRSTDKTLEKAITKAEAFISNRKHLEFWSKGKKMRALGKEVAEREALLKSLAGDENAQKKHRLTEEISERKREIIQLTEEEKELLTPRVSM